MLNLGVNIDHVATVRQARLANSPKPIEAARLAEAAGAWGITAHLREDRRHIQDADIEELAAGVGRLNMEMAVTPEMVEIATRGASAQLLPGSGEAGGTDDRGGAGRRRAACQSA